MLEASEDGPIPERSGLPKALLAHIEQFRQKHIRRVDEREKSRRRLPSGSHAQVARQLQSLKDDQGLEDVGALQLPPSVISDELAPGCFGSALTFKKGASECEVCLFAARCEPISKARERRLSKRLASDPEIMAEIEAERARNRRNKQKQRRRDRLGQSKQSAEAKKARSITNAEIMARGGQLKEWLATPGPRQSQIRKRAGEIMRSWILLEERRRELGVNPTPSDFASSLAQKLGRSLNRSQGQKRLALLQSLEEPGGPWAI